ncbi:MAG: glutamate mutase L [Ardenticatenaceae bacterium]|nr:glutamate mutase L [Ardenticatenaceae bacterium]MCB8949058.1 glutamate mutase L [Ardenticatenaceae bacterium]
MTTEEPQVEKYESFLVADCGSTHTTVVLFDIVAGAYRLIARTAVPTTANAPWFDVAQGVQQAISHISEITGRKLLSEQGRLIRPVRTDGSGVDHFTAVASAAQPLDVLLVGLFDEVSITSARKALRSVYHQEKDHLSLSDQRRPHEQVSAVVQSQPDLIFITGGTDGGAEDRLLQVVESVGLGVSVMSDSKVPEVVFAGNIKLRERVQAMLSDYANVQMANNLRPTLETEQLDDAVRLVTELYEDLKINELSGVQELIDWSSYPILPTAHAFSEICHYFAALQNQNVFGVDLGSNSVSLITATPEQVQLSIHSELGMGSPVANLLDKVSVDEVRQWVPVEVSAAETADYIFSKALHPFGISTDEKSLQMEQAVARTLIRCAVTTAGHDNRWPVIGEQQVPPPFSLLLARGSTLANAPRPGQIILMLLDALQPTGIFSIALDRYGVLPALGALAAHQPLAVIQSLEAGVLSNLGWVIAPIGKGQLGKKAMDITIESERVSFEGEIEFGKIEIFPIAPGKSAKVTVKPSSRLDIGFGPGQGKKMTLTGGLAGGLVIDARGRPFVLPRDVADRRSLMRKWLWDMGG